MSSSSTAAKRPIQVQPEDAVQPDKELGYAALSQQQELGFDPMKDLNLPASYEEVNSRFRRLQSGKPIDALN